MKNYSDGNKLIIKITVVLLIIFCLVTTLLLILYRKGFFAKEEYSGLNIYYLYIDNTLIQENIETDSVIELTLSDCKNKKISLVSGWKYEYKNSISLKDIPIIMYRNIDYIIWKSNEIYFDDDNDQNFYRKAGTYIYNKNFDFEINNVGEYDIFMNLIIAIDDRSYAQVKKIKIIVSE